MANEYESRGNLAAPHQGEPQEINPGAIFYGENKDDEPIMPGDRLHVSGFYNILGSVAFQYAYRRLLNNKLKIAVSLASAKDVEEFLTYNAIALTPATKKHICKFKFTPSDFFLSTVYVPSGVTPNAIYGYYIDSRGVALGGEKTDDAFAKTWGDYSQPSDPDQQGGKYIVALCRRLQEELTGDAVMATLDVNSSSTVTDVTATKGTVQKIDSASASISTIDTASLSLSGTQTQGAVEVVTDIQAIGGALGVETKYLYFNLTSSVKTVNVALTTSSQQVVTDVAKTTANRVSSVTAKAN